jgi:hypothetical protein
MIRAEEAAHRSIDVPAGDLMTLENDLVIHATDGTGRVRPEPAISLLLAQIITSRIRFHNQSPS